MTLEVEEGSIHDAFVAATADTLDSMIESMQGQKEEPPAYMKQTWASTRPNCGNDESERVRNSFRTGSWWTIKKLPADLAAGNVENARKRNVIKNRLGKREFQYKAMTVTNYFTPMQYQYSDFDKADMNEKNERERSQMKMTSFNREPFSVSNRIKTRTEDTFSDKEYKVPYMGPGADKLNMSQITRADTFNVSQFTAGPFNPAGKKQSDVTRSLIREWITKIYETLAEFWPTLRYIIKWTGEDEMDITFSFDPKDGADGAIPPNNALLKFMNALATTGLAAELKLTRRGDRWNVPFPREPVEGVPPGLQFVFYAPWIKRGYVTVRKAMSAYQRDMVRDKRDKEDARKAAAYYDMYGSEPPTPQGSRSTVRTGSRLLQPRSPATHGR